MTHSTLHISTTALLTVTGLQDRNGTYQNAATVTLESLVVRGTGDAVSGVSTPLALSYVAASDGDYEVEIPHTVGIEDGGTYIATLKAVSGSMEKVWKETVRASYAVAPK